MFERIKAACDDKGVSLYRMAKDNKLKLSTVYSWQRGVLPRLDTLMVVADYLGVSMDYICKG